MRTLTAFSALVLMSSCGGGGETCVPGRSIGCVGESLCEGVQICAAHGESYGACLCGDFDAGGGDAGPGADSGSDDAGNPPDAASDAPGACEGWRDRTLTSDPDALARSAAYEAQYWPHREALEFQISNQFEDGRWTDARAQEPPSCYSSGWGLASYHSMDEIIGLTQLMEVASDESHRLYYAALVQETLDITVSAIAEGRGTETCVDSVCAGSQLHLCSPGNFRYLDAGHGAGAAGYAMNAIYENCSLRAMYADDLERWATALVPTLERHSSWTESTEPTGVPHMPAKISAAYLAVGKILDEPQYIDGFENIVRLFAASAESNSPSGWVGSDVSHARVTSAAMNLAFREQIRGTIPTILTADHFRRMGDVFEAAIARRPYPECLGVPLVGHHGMLVRFSDTFADLVEPTYSLGDESPGNHGWGCVAETIAGLAMGHATPLSAADAL